MALTIKVYIYAQIYCMMYIYGGMVAPENCNSRHPLHAAALWILYIQLEDLRMALQLRLAELA